MATEIEIKLAIRDGKGLQRALKRLGAKPANPKAPRMHEMNVIFDLPEEKKRLSQSRKLKT